MPFMLIMGLPRTPIYWDSREDNTWHKWHWKMDGEGNVFLQIMHVLSGRIMFLLNDSE